MTFRVPFAPRHRAAVLALGLSAVPAAFAQTPNLRETVVTASRTATRLDEQLGDVTVLTRADIERSGAPGLLELLATQPGIQATPDSIRGGNASVFVRGANHQQTLVLVDGQRISSATTGATALQHLPIGQIERIEILRGPASSLYGSDAIGGVIQVFTRAGSGRPTASGAVTLGSYGTVATSVGYGGQAGDTRFHLQAGAENSQGFSDIRAAKGGLYDSFNPDRDGYRQRNLGLKATRQVSPDLELGASYLVTEGLKRNDGLNCDANGAVCTANFDNRDLQRLQTLALHAGWQVSPTWKSLLRVGLSEDALRSWLYDPLASKVTVERYITTQRQVTWQNDLRVGPGLLMAALEWRGVQADTTKTLVASSQDTSSASLGYQAWIGSHLLQASARHDRVQRIGSSNTGTFAYGYRVAPGWTARASAGTGFRAPSFNDLYWPVDYANFYAGNPNLRPERSRNAEAGLVYEAGDTRVAATAYRNRVRDLIEITTDMSTYMSTMSNVSTATLEGLSLQARTRWDRWALGAAYDVQSPRNDTTGNLLQRRVPRMATLDLSRRVDRLELGAVVQGFSARFNDAANRQRLAGYGLVTLRAAYAVDKHLTLTAHLRNALDKDYVVNRGTFSPYNDYATAGRSLFVGLRYTGL